MGYYTSYELAVRRMECDEESSVEKLAKIKEQMMYADSVQEMSDLIDGSGIISDESILRHIIGENSEAEYSIEEDGTSSGTSSKWYAHDKDLLAFSKKYPEWLFILGGEGEESGDMWVHYFLDGKIQKCPAKITFDEFDKNKLE